MQSQQICENIYITSNGEKYIEKKAYKKERAETVDRH